ncbi:unannotated protein [freshwater metagenome]|uniref:Unannotated protein n=1 Tax=freshwater metagenome TaxID=449393 RepID=A0A6J5YZ99_9ZZZZ
MVQLGQPEPLGATLFNEGTNFAIWAPEADRVELCLFDSDGSHHNLDLKGHTKGVFHIFVPGLKAGQEYGFRVHGTWQPESGQRFNPAKLLLDPYAKAVSGSLILDESIFGHVGGDDLIFNDKDSANFVPHSVVIDTSYDWEDDCPPDVAFNETIIYETHLRGLTQLHPEIPQDVRGTYAGMAHPAILQHLTKLGVTTVELLPVQHFVSETFLLGQGLSNYWGYNTIAFFAPHAGYSSSGSHGQQVREFKDMIKAFHRAGLEVILDVVYNHTAEGNEFGPTLSLRGIDNACYYHLSDEGRSYWDSTGCGNTVRAGNPQTLRLIMDSLRYWVSEMHVDGFRFDLATALTRNSDHVPDITGPLVSAIAQDPLLRSVKLIAEPWDVGDAGYQLGSFPDPWSEWNDQFRDCVRDFWRGQSSGVAELGWRLTGSGDVYWAHTGGTHASINFITAHDGFTLRDVVSYNAKHNLANREDGRDGTENNRSWNCGVEGETLDPEILRHRQRQIRNLLATTVLSAGIPMLVAGDEIGKTQSGNNNAYCQDNEISWLSWAVDDWQQSLFNFTSLLTKIRREHRVFQRDRFLTGEKVELVNVPDIAWLRADSSEFTQSDWDSPDTRALGMYLAGAVSTIESHDMVDNGFYWFLNSSDASIEVTLPSGHFGDEYVLQFNTADEGDWTNEEPTASGTIVTLMPWSTALWMVTRRDAKL